MGIHGLGRKSVAEKYNNPSVYLNKHVFPILDLLEMLKKEERDAEKALQAATNKKNLQQQKLDWAYHGLERWRK